MGRRVGLAILMGSMRFGGCGAAPGWPLPRPLSACCACGEGRIRSRFGWLPAPNCQAQSAKAEFVTFQPRFQ